MGPSNISFLSFRVVFHFHDYGRKGKCHAILFWGDFFSSAENSGKNMEKKIVYIDFLFRGHSMGHIFLGGGSNKQQMLLVVLRDLS